EGGWRKLGERKAMSVSAWTHARAMGCRFFFQAEDGIRGATVTGVQTCALPISRKWAVRGAVLGVAQLVLTIIWKLFENAVLGWRSEERRVGNECRYPRTRWQDKQRITSNVRKHWCKSSRTCTSSSEVSALSAIH